MITWTLQIISPDYWIGNSDAPLPDEDEAGFVDAVYENVAVIPADMLEDTLREWIEAYSPPRLVMRYYPA